MKRNGQISGLILAGAGLLLAPAAFAQAERSNRIDPHPVRQQVGIIARVIASNAWAAFPHPVKSGTQVEISAFSDGGDTLFTGTVTWASPVAPYEVYLTKVHAVSTKHDLNEFKDYYSIGALTKRQVNYGTEPEVNGNGIFLSAGLAARAVFDDAPASDDTNLEPVRANIAALRAQNTKIATSIADAAEKALGLDPLISAEEQIADYAVNYTILTDSLRNFSRLRITDAITERLLSRLNALARDSGRVSEPVPGNFFRPQRDTGTDSGSSGGTRN